MREIATENADKHIPEDPHIKSLRLPTLSITKMQINVMKTWMPLKIIVTYVGHVPFRPTLSKILFE